MSALLLDTHAAVWAAEGMLPSSLGKQIDAAARRGELMLSPITAWEIGMLVAKRRLAVSPSVEAYVRGLFVQSGIVSAILTPEIALQASRLPGDFHGDPADRLLVASAVAYNAQFVTRDQRIQAYARQTKLLRCVAC
jgi:PIN domain nuclease of toxin-antitoxin system